MYPIPIEWTSLLVLAESESEPKSDVQQEEEEQQCLLCPCRRAAERCELEMAE